MGAELGRISGPLLSANLLRNGTDLAFETSLLYFDVNNGRIGVNTDAPSRELTVNGTTGTTNLIVDTLVDIADFVISSNTIQNPTGSIIIAPDQSVDPTIVLNRLSTPSFNITDQLINNTINNSDTNLTANGIGRVIFNTTEVRVNGGLHATGDITWDGSITFGDSSNDSVTFSADLASNITPDLDNTYTLGSPGKTWKELYSINVNAVSVETTSITAAGIDLILTPGNTIYVSANGNDSNIGTHIHATFSSLKHALSVAVAGDEVVVFPGTYTEDFPLTVPQGVSVRGTSIRSVTVQPTVSTKTQDAFLLNGETSVSFLTIANVFYDSINNTGYAFRFAPNITVTSRSPYMQNVTVINRGSVTTAEDPMGFLQGDAGGGAYLDGSVANPLSPLPPGGLFFAVTFITPNQDGITATNGVRVEWLNSFTYFAKRGIFLNEGTLGLGSLGVKFGAEMRSINSANVYGTYGAVAIGANTLGYLIGHNFGYIGTGGDSQNDYGLVVQANEVVPIDGGVLYYDSMDQKGDYRIGDVFYVNQQTGQVSFDARSISFTADGSIVIEGLHGSIILDAYSVQAGNIRVHDNNIDSLSGPVNLVAQSGTTTLNTNVFVTGSLAVTGDTHVEGNVFLGNDQFDLVTVSPNLTQTIKPNTNSTFTLGTNGLTPKIWNKAFFELLDIDGVTQITNNTISTLTSNTDLRVVAAGSGQVHVASTDVVISNSLTTVGTTTINGTSSLKNVVISSPTLFTTNGVQNVAGGNGPTGIFFLNNWFLPPHDIAGLQYVRPGWTVTTIPGAVVTAVGDGITDETITITGGVFVSGQAYAFTGYVPGPATTNLTGNINQTGNTYITGLFSNVNTQIIGSSSYLQVPNVKIQNNVVSATATDSDIIFTASGLGGVVLDSKLKIIDDVVSNVWAGATTDTQKSIILSPNGSGNTLIDSTKALVLPIGNSSTRNLTTIGDLRLNNNSGLVEGYVTGGRVNLMNLYSSTRQAYITPELTPGANDSTLRFAVNSTVRATITATSLNTSLMQVDNITLTGNTINNTVSGNDLILSSAVVNDIGFNDDTITNNSSGALVLANTGQGYVKFNGTGAVVFPFGTTDDRRDTPDVGEARYNSTLNYMEVYTGTTWIPAVGTLGAAPLELVLDIMDEWAFILG